MIDAKTITRNTVVLYIRMAILLLLNLYITKRVLSTLGILDYGVYNVVGGFVSMFAILSTSLSQSISRYITFYLGKKKESILNVVFCTSVNIQIFMGISVIIICEIIGIWFLNNKMNIPLDRIDAANWILQFSVFSFFLGLLNVPYNALIIAHEKMSIFAFVSVFDALLRLISIIIIEHLYFDKLIMWGGALLIISFFVRILYGIYCAINFEEAKYHFKFDKSLFKEMGAFAGWTMIGDAAGILKNQGVNVLLNIFFGPIINAANAVAMQVSGVIAQFYSNFLVAVNPQITKSYANKNVIESYELVKFSTRISFLLVLIVIVPIFSETKYILEIWLDRMPEYSVVFTRLLLIVSVIELFSFPLITLQRATGKVRDYQIVVGSIHLLNFPISYFFLYYGFLPSVVYFISIGLALVNMFMRLYMLKRILPVISIKDFFKEVVLRSLFTLSIVAILLLIIFSQFSEKHIFNIVISFTVTIMVCYIVGVKKDEKKILFSFLSI